jgi:radical SAM protein with 4Fe4S-binding SPASM domain
MTKNISIPKNAHFKECYECIVAPICSEQCEPVRNFVKNFVEEWRTINGRKDLRPNDPQHSSRKNLS